MTQLLSNLPAWIYAVFFGLLHFGYAQSKTRNVSRTRITLLPLVFVSLSLYGVLHLPNSTALAALAWMVGIALAFLINAKIPHGAGVVLHPDSQHYVVPGSWIPLGLFMSVFITKFALGYLIGSHSVNPESLNFVLISSAVSGLISGTFAARAIQIFKTGNANAATPRAFSTAISTTA